MCHISLACALATAESSTSHLYTLDPVTIILFLLHSGHETMPSVQRKANRRARLALVPSTVCRAGR